MNGWLLLFRLVLFARQVAPPVESSPAPPRRPWWWWWPRG
jgi:hypothetical protein